MRASSDRLLFSATDLADFLDCEHLTTLGRRVAVGEMTLRHYADPTRQVLEERGREHEARHLAALRAGGVEVVEINLAPPRDAATWARAAEETAAAVRRGVGVVYQATFVQDEWRGQADFLVRVARPSALGPWSYEVVDTKLARHARARAIIQLVVYSELLGRLQGVVPELMRLVLGGDAGEETHRVDDYLAYVRSLRRRFADRFGAALPDTYPEPVEHCGVCDFASVCDSQLRADDHLSLVAGITRHQRERLGERDIRTLAGLGSLALPAQPPIAGIGKPALIRVREQARLQLDGRAQKTILHELITPITDECGLASLPAPSPGDLFFDIEGDPFAVEGGLEYLFGLVQADTGNYRAFWALDQEQEKRSFEELVRVIMERLGRHPDMHVFHYAPYEPTALKRLMGRYGVCEDDVDRLLRGGVFVDLYRAVRQGVRAAVESYSIKRLEPLYGFTRAVDLKDASGSLRQFETYLGLGGRGGAADSDILRNIEAYNRDDCLSARELRDWLELQRAQLEKRGISVPRPAPEDANPTDKVREEVARARALTERLSAGVPADPAQRTPEQQACWLLAQLLEWHRREEKSAWWDYYRMRDLSEDERIEDSRVLGGLKYVGEVGTIKQSKIHRYRFLPQEHDIRPDHKVCDPQTGKSPGDVAAVDDAAGTVDLKRGKNSRAPHPVALIPDDLVKADELKASIVRIASWVTENGIDADGPNDGTNEGPTAGPYRATRNLLLRRPPRSRNVVELAGDVLPIQGPPGSGKTYRGARMIVELLAAGKKVGITANSHKVICKLLDETTATARAAGVAFSAVQKVNDEKEGCSEPSVSLLEENKDVVAAIENGATLVAGTAWLWARPDMVAKVDVLFIDEAGQMSLANVVAASAGASALVLLGDPQQLDQPTRGVHPPGVDVSALEHLLGEHATITEERGIFLPETRRMHPDVCSFISQAFYEGRLQPMPGLERQTLTGPGPLSGTGLRYVGVSHRGNQNESREEVEVVARLYTSLLDGRTTWTDKEGRQSPLTPQDVLVVAPYNAHVDALRARLGPAARVGTVDKFQGQEAPVVFYSMATSTAEDAPRGMEFLYSLNRLNVAISRAQGLAVLVASPALFQARCRTPRQIRLANALCRILEVSVEVQA